ncbi:MAG: radical SAM protein [Acidimicrobiia bacterium]
MLGLRRKARGRSRILWLDLGDFKDLYSSSGAIEKWQDHGLGLLRTILHQNGIVTELESTRLASSWRQVKRFLRDYDLLLMNVRSYTFPMAYRSAQLFKEVNPRGLVIAGGMHATVAPDEMLRIDAFDRICQGPGERVIVDLVKAPLSFPRLVPGVGAASLGEWPLIDRTLWPKPAGWFQRDWPLEKDCGWGPSPVATLITSRVCPWRCVFCNEASYIPNMGRKPVDRVIEELNYLDEKFGPLGSVVIHDSMFFQQPRWLEEWLDKYPRLAKRTWPYWAAGRADTVRQWPEMFEALVRETNWNMVSIGFESGSDRVLKILNKECTAEDNYFAIDLLNRIGDEMERQGKKAPRFWTNIMFGIPGETHEDAFETIRMLKSMPRAVPSIAFYAPYPGSALGYQLTAEGRSLMTKENYHRFPNDEKVRGIDYKFYRDLLKGRYDAEIFQGRPGGDGGRREAYADALTKA